MGFVQLTQVSLYFGERTIFQDLSLALDTNSKVSLTGSNGSGKSTLMKIIAQEIETQGGKVSKSPGVRIAYLPQTGITYKDMTIQQVGRSAFIHLDTLADQIRSIESTLAEMQVESEQTYTLLDELHTLQERLINSTYYRQEEMISRVYQGLGFTQEEIMRPCSTFSGGWQMRIALGKVLLEEPDIMLLDEPTNYLDLEARLWLEEFLNIFSGGTMVVSHDRDFLDAITREVYDIDHETIVVYKGNYSAFLIAREERIAQLIREKERQDRERERLQQFIDRFRAKDSKAAQVRDRIKKLERLKEIVIPEAKQSIHFSFPPPPRSGDKVLTIEGLAKAYGANQVFSNFNLEITRGDRIVLLGKNGAGKSTLMKILAGSLQADTGSLEWGTKVYPGYFSQESDLPRGMQIYDAAMEVAPPDMGTRIRSLLGAFLFSGDDMYKETGYLSGGEESRLRLLRLLLQPVNLLILDEPTNHLDLQAKEILLHALREFTGTLIFVSHDLYFIKELANRVVVMDEKPPKIYQGDYSYYRWRRDQEIGAYAYESAETGIATRMGQPQGGGSSSVASGGAAAVALGRGVSQGGGNPSRANSTGRVTGSTTGSGVTKALATGESLSEGKLSHKEQKERKNRMQRAERQEAALAQELEQAETTLEELHNKLATPEVYTDPEAAAQVQENIESTEEIIEKIQEQWELVVLELDSLK